MSDLQQFSSRFHELTGVPPLAWQCRLYDQYFTRGWRHLPQVIDLPTGLGKTMVMAIWLIARENNFDAPTRLIYVVDRRTVVDQASDLAKKLQCNFGKDRLAISTLRGQLADNREWSIDPSHPAIIIGTVDLIGSALLFSGYRSSYKRRPLEAGLLGQDSLLVLDEAQLSKPFAKLIASISAFQAPNAKPMRVIHMSATSTGSDSKPFQLTESDFSDAIINRRFNARKRLTVKSADPKKLKDALAGAAIELAKNADIVGKRIVVFVRRPDDARAIADAIRSYAVESVDSSSPKPRKNKTFPYAEHVKVLTGTMRGLERDELVANDVFKYRWLDGNLDPSDPVNQQPVFLISTSAGEVGFDLNADHLVGDSAPLDSWIQRLGRVNRRGNGDATVILIKEETPADKTDFEKACIAASNLLADGMDVNPSALATFRKSLSSAQLEAASTPNPKMVELTDILIDAWSMTSIIKPMPGRPEVGPWLRGKDDEAPQTTIAWRAELELLADNSDSMTKFKAIFAAHRIRPHESITTSSGRVVEFLQKVTKDKSRWPELKATQVVVKLPRDLLVKTLGDLIDNPGILFTEPTLILPATFGGLDKGMLSHEKIASATKTVGDTSRSLDVADAENYERSEDLATRWRIVLERADRSWKLKPMPFGREQNIPIAELLGLEGELHSREDIRDALRKKRLRIREIIRFDLDHEGDPRKLLFLLSGSSPKAERQSQPLDDHIGAVEATAKRIADDLHLNPGDPFREALLCAAKWHDEGKRSPVWQRFIGGSVEIPRGKSAEYCDPSKLGGYRHEFGSLLRVLHPDPAENREKPALPANKDVRELSLHLIGCHHGHDRPHFSNTVDRDFHKPAEIGAVHTESIRRFAHLQRKYGWWHLTWLENLLRCADAIASAQVNDDENQDDQPEAE
jgi:CRISPR-associated endonuclease/helicase Cas3